MHAIIQTLQFAPVSWWSIDDRLLWSRYKNFQSVSVAMMTLFGVATGDGFSCMVHSVMVEESGKSWAVRGACSEAEGTCGEPITARFYFICFELIITFTTIEMFGEITSNPENLRSHFLSEMDCLRLQSM